MYNSLKQWLKVPVKIKPYQGMDGAGNYEYYEPISTVCYPDIQYETVKDEQGAEVVAQTVLYFDSTETINSKDIIVFNNEEYEVKSINPYYDGNTGKLSIWVVGI